MAKASKKTEAKAKATEGAAGEGAIRRRLVLDVRPVDEIPPTLRGGVVGEVVAALADKESGDYSIGKYENTGSAGAMVRSLRKAGLEACQRDGEVFVTIGG